MQIFHYTDKGEYLKQGVAREDPKAPGNFLIPRNATTIPPSPDVQRRAMAGIWDGSKWLEKHRSKT